MLTILSLIVFLLLIFLNFYINKSFEIGNKNELYISGGELLNHLKNKYGYNNLKINYIDGKLTDHYMPLSNEINLSNEVYYGKGISSLAVSLHEFGHFLQHNEGSVISKIHSLLFPLANFSSVGGIILFIIGNLFSLSNLMLIGIIVFSITTVYYLLLSFLEFDASNRGYKIFLNEFYGIDNESKFLFKKMLFIAFLTYFLSFIQSFIQLLEMFLKYKEK